MKRKNRCIDRTILLLVLTAVILSFSAPFSAAEAAKDGKYGLAAEKALETLEEMLYEGSGKIYVYRDFGDTENHFTQKALIAGYDAALVHDMDENWQNAPFRGDSCIRCEQITREGDWGGWLFLNGWLPENSAVPQLNDGSVPDQGMDLSGAERLTFYARGERGGEQVEFFTCGFGYNGEWNVPTAEYPDSTGKKTLGIVTLDRQWRQYSIDLNGADLSSVACGFGYVLSGGAFGNGEKIFYLDEVLFEGDFSGRSALRLLRSYQTQNIFIRNAAFSYDNALVAMAFLSAGKQAEAAQILDAFVYAAEHDRYLPGRVRNAYAAGDITAIPGWGDAARLPGWYDAKAGRWYEDRYQTGSNVGNTSYVTLALLQYDARYGNERYRNTAVKLMDWVIDNCSDGDAGFTAGYDGWPENGEATTYLFTYKSIEHNIDAYAAFRELYRRTGKERYHKAAESALAFIRSMYDENRKLFYAGTLEDGITPNRDNIVLDAQVWACLALGDHFAPYEAALDTVSAMETAEGGYPFCMANVNGGWWTEGTAYTALMFRLLGMQEREDSAMNALLTIQRDDGLFPAATTDHLSTDFALFDGSPWEYSTDVHIAPTAWFILAANGTNPYTFS